MFYNYLIFCSGENIKKLVTFLGVTNLTEREVRREKSHRALRLISMQSKNPERFFSSSWFR